MEEGGMKEGDQWGVKGWITGKEKIQGWEGSRRVYDWTIYVKVVNYTLNVSVFLLI